MTTLRCYAWLGVVAGLTVKNSARLGPMACMEVDTGRHDWRIWRLFIELWGRNREWLWSWMCSYFFPDGACILQRGLDVAPFGIFASYNIAQKWVWGNIYASRKCKLSEETRFKHNKISRKTRLVVWGWCHWEHRWHSAAMGQVLGSMELMTHNTASECRSGITSSMLTLGPVFSEKCGKCEVL